jgi:hypothetical protein
MPSTVIVQGQIQAAIPHVPRLDDPNYDPLDTRSSGHIVDGIDARMDDMINDHRILRSLQSAVMHRAVVDAGKSVRRHFKLKLHENGSYIYSIEMATSNAGRINASSMVGSEIAGAQILQAPEDPRY